MKQHFLDLDPADIERMVTGLGHPAYRAAQLVEWIYQKQAPDFSSCKTLPADLRAKLTEQFTLASLTLVGKERSALDGTVRYAFKTSDAHTVFAVYLPTRDRRSVCISSQAGCPVSCRFCSSGAVKFRRNLTRGEMIEQVATVARDTGQRITGVLFMGMGEPLLNYTAVVSAIRSLADYAQFGIGRRHITLSTVGLVPAIRKLADEQLGVRLALSLHAADDETRKTLIPERAVPYRLADIVEAGLFYARRNKARLTIEYIVIDGVNASIASMSALVDLLKRHTYPSDQVQVNLIPYNETKGAVSGRHCRGTKKAMHLKAPFPDVLEQIRNYLVKRSVLATIREPKGADIAAACGQLGF